MQEWGVLGQHARHGAAMLVEGLRVCVGRSGHKLRFPVDICHAKTDVAIGRAQNGGNRARERRGRD